MLLLTLAFSFVKKKKQEGKKMQYFLEKPFSFKILIYA
jgi:hypothetical protein